MKLSIVLIVVLWAGLLCGTALCQPGIAPPDPDRLGVYTTEDCANDNVDVGSGGQTTIYCVLTGMSELELSNFDFYLRAESSSQLFILNHSIPPNWINLATVPEFYVAIDVPIPPGMYDELTLVSLTYLLMDYSPVYFFLEPVYSYSPLIPGSMSYGHLGIDQVPMSPVSGRHSSPVFGFNTGHVWYGVVGEILIMAQPEIYGHSWVLSGPDDFEHVGIGVQTLSGMQPGSYSLLWNEITEWVPPSPNPVEFTLEPGGTVQIEGTFRPLPQIQSVADVPNDQGRQARITWQRCPFDKTGEDYTITQYGVYRQQPAGSPEKLDGWDFIGSVPARTDLNYQFVASTLCDSTITDGLCETTFMISAMTADPGVFFDSLPGTGYSVDNLRPITPSGFKVEFNADQNVLTWDAPVDTDVDHYLVYRTNGSGAPPDPADKPLAVVQDTAYDDNDGGWGYAYWLVAVDHTGNRSDLTDWSDADISSVGNGSLPRKVALYPAVPNPFNPATTISFDLPRDQHVRLAIYGIDGRLIANLVNEMRGAGTNHCLWRGTNDAGQRVASGTYVYRMETEGFTDSGRLMLLK